MALLLPKGIVVNSDSIEESIERIAAESLDEAEIAKFWKVYTTTNRRLLDPTAERLENHWWRIWQSDRKFLNAATISRLFAHISTGPTFVPLRGPPNRVDDTRPSNIIQHGPGASSTSAIHRPPPGPSTGSNTTVSSTASRAQIPMPHPILKKTRGPSTTGPRPTARFISPHESEHEPDQPSPISPNSHVVVQPPSPDPRDPKPDKKAGSTSSRKKAGYVASTKKKRPVITRRQSSQESRSSADGTIKEGDAVQGSLGSQPPSGGPKLGEPSQVQKQSRFQENFSPSPEKSSVSAQTKKKTSRTGDAKRNTPRKSSNGKERADPSQIDEQAPPIGEPGPSTQLRRIENQQDAAELTAEELEELEIQRLLLAEANARVQRKQSQELARTAEPSERLEILHRSLRSRSTGNLEAEGMDAIRFTLHDSKGSPSLAPTLAAAAGHSTLGDEPSGSKTTTKDVKGKGRAIEESKPTDMFAKRPVQPIKAARSSENLSRSKSQLTMLLQKDSEKKDRNKHESEKEHKRKK